MLSCSCWHSSSRCWSPVAGSCPRHGGTFELSVRDASEPDGRGWVLGLGRYREDSLEWYRIFSPLPVPKRSWRRSDLSLLSQRVPRQAEEYALYAGSVVVTCTTPRGDTELAMSPSSLTGLQAWLEAGPPGSSPDPLELAEPGILVPTRTGETRGRQGRPELGPLAGRCGNAEPPGRDAVQRSPPGTQRTSPFSRLAWRARMNSRSESRLR